MAVTYFQVYLIGTHEYLIGAGTAGLAVSVECLRKNSILVPLKFQDAPPATITRSFVCDCHFTDEGNVRRPDGSRPYHPGMSLLVNLFSPYGRANPN